ncbi:hypothetical protein BDZ97DRAFT_1761559 [Flammula alnicola]|nr:hypothetical protein BDZ97DRAFT_1761559 [Flammula alnicola]
MAHRPSYKVKQASFELTLPVGWTYITVGISRQKYHQLVTIDNSLYPDSKIRLRNAWGKNNETMKDHRNPTLHSATMEAQTEAAIVTFDFFYSATKVATQSIPSLQIDANRSSNMQLNKPPSTSKKIPDYMTLFIFVLDSAVNRVPNASFDDMALTVNLVYRPLAADDFFDEPDNPNPDPPPPPPNTEPGYNPLLDIKRPSTIENYLKFYDTVFLIDDSGSMEEDSPTKWQQCVQAVTAIADTAIDNNTDGIDIYFLNSDAIFKMKDEVRGITDKSKVKAALDRVGPNGNTPTGERLGERLQEHLRKIDDVVGKDFSYREIKPLDLIVITDGSPNDNNLCKYELESAAKHITDNNYHPNHIGVQFVQIGNDHGARDRLHELAHANVDGMVDTVPYMTTLTGDDLKRILLGGMHPNLRVLRNNP